MELRRHFNREEPPDLDVNAAAHVVIGRPRMAS
jgi:hypothetical protein